jgi:hypothetical protein
VQKWLTFIGKYIREWESARTNVWSSDVPFDPELFEEYCRRYNRCTRTCLTKAKDPKEYFEPALCDMYETGSSGGTRIQAVSYYNKMLLCYTLYFLANRTHSIWLYFCRPMR